LQLANNLDAGIMNGDVGEIVRITNPNAKAEILVDFDGNEVTFSRDDLISLTHAYAMSIHKSQGSEYPVVIMPITRAYYIMLQRKLIYTGMTRASRSLILIGDYEALKYAAENEGAIRQTMLKDRVTNNFLSTAEPDDKIPEIIINQYSEYFSEHNIPFSGIDEIALEGKTPYDYM